MTQEPNWQIAVFEILGLFGDRNLRISFPENRRVYFLHGDNGLGKTTAMIVLNAVLSQDDERLMEIEFSEAIVTFKDGRQLRARSETTEVLKRRLVKESIEIPVVEFEMKLPGDSKFKKMPKSQRAEWDKIKIGDVNDTEYFRNKAIRVVKAKKLDRSMVIPIDKWLRERAIEESFDWHSQSKIDPIYKISLDTVFISSNRLQKEIEEIRRPGRPSSRFDSDLDERTRTVETTIEFNTRKMHRIITSQIRQSFLESSQVDREFPRKVVDALKKQASPTQEELDYLVEEVRALQNKLVDEGPFMNRPLDLELDLQSEDPATRTVVSLFYEGMLQKLRSTTPLQEKTNLFKTIVNAKLNGKTLKVIPDGYEVVDRNNKVLPLNALSSGEQHQIVLMFDLLFGYMSEQTLFLVDEPELSMHVSWQEQFASDLELIAEVNGGTFLLATHSPVIVNENWDSLVAFEVELIDS
jgi:ABC-type transport system involved in cytochrome c biogenesis ATPase subunit/energy-coupling factor transporter ATP-binding protein EcfA2